MITPTKIILHGLTSLKNIEIVEINREPHKEFFQPTGDMRNRLDAIVAGCAVDSTYQNEFSYDEQAMFIEPGVWPQVRSDNILFPHYPYNFDTDPDILAIPDGTPDEHLENDYRWMLDIPYIEGAPLFSNIQFDGYPQFISAGMDVEFIQNQEITDLFKDTFTVRHNDGRHDLDDLHLSKSFHIMWNKVAQSEQDWAGPSIPPVTYPKGYLLDDRYRDHFPQYNKLFQKQLDRLWHDPTLPQYPMLLERDWVRYWFYIPNLPIRDTFRVIWNGVAHDSAPWKLHQLDPQIIHGARFNWKGWHKPKSIEDLSYYTLWKMNTKSNPDKPWENQKNRSFYEPDRVFVEKNPDNYHAYLGDWIRDHYYTFNDPSVGTFEGYAGWYPWINPSAPYTSDEKYWDTGRTYMGFPGGLWQSPYSVQTSNNPSRQNPEVFRYKYIGDDRYQIWLDGVNEGDYSEQHLPGVNSIRLLVYNASINTVLHDIVNPVGYQQPTTFIIDGLAEGSVYDVYVNIANRAGIRQGKLFKIDRTKFE